MANLFSKLLRKESKLKKSGLLDKKSDVHSHILYGVDDGVEELEESLQILKELEELESNKEKAKERYKIEAKNRVKR